MTKNDVLEAGRAALLGLACLCALPACRDGASLPRAGGTDGVAPVPSVATTTPDAPAGGGAAPAGSGTSPAGTSMPSSGNASPTPTSGGATPVPGSTTGAGGMPTPGTVTTSPPAGSAPATPVPAPKVMKLSGDVGVPGDILYLPFDVPAGVDRIDALFVDGSPTTKLGLGIFDQTGTAFQGGGFRGITGEERRSFFLATDTATLGFVAGPMKPGRWTIVVPNFLNASGTAVVQVTMTYGPTLATPARLPVPEVVTDAPGWYRGDLHVHTSHSSDSFSSGKSLMPGPMARRAKGLGLDFIALSDHNVTEQNNRLPEAQPPGFLLLAGEEITTWVGGPGHVTAAGLSPGEHVDWRFRPQTGKYARTPTWKADDRPIQALLAYTRPRGIFTSANHPYVTPGLGSDWGFFEDEDLDPNAFPDALEIWNGDFVSSTGEATLKQWDVELARGVHLCANGGSDLHGIDSGVEVGTPTTVVFASQLSRAAIVDALKNCRAYITNGPKGPALMLTASLAGKPTQMMGDTVQGAPSDVMTVAARVVGAKGAVVTLVQNGAVVGTGTLSADDQTLAFSVPLGASGAIRAELRPTSFAVPTNPGTPGSDATNFPRNQAGLVAPLALSNPIFLKNGLPVPAQPPVTVPTTPTLPIALSVMPLSVAWAQALLAKGVAH